ncbi:MAG: cache domain-containing protein [Xanthobacteraceae bacterium]
MTFRRSAPAALIAAVIVVVVALTVLSERLFSGITSEAEAGQFQLMQAILDTAIRNASEEALARADIIAALPVTKQAVAAKDRERLLAEFTEMFAVQRERRGVDQAQFHVPPAHSLLRLHTPTAFGDDLARFRPMVVATHREQAARKGLAIARRGPAIFGVAPVHDAQGKFIGSFEFGLDFAPVLASLKAAYGLDFALFVEERPLREFARGLDPAVLGDQNRLGRFIRFFTTNAALVRNLAVETDIASVNEPTRYTRDAQGLPYGVLLMPLRDGAGDPIGVVAVARDFSGSRAAAGRSLVWQICLAIFAIVILSGAVLVVIRGFLLRPLDAINKRLDAIAAGRSVEPLPASDKFCAEMRPLAELDQRMRTQHPLGAAS